MIDLKNLPIYKTYTLNGVEADVTEFELVEQFTSQILEEAAKKHMKLRACPEEYRATSDAREQGGSVIRLIAFATAKTLRGYAIADVRDPTDERNRKSFFTAHLVPERVYDSIVITTYMNTAGILNAKRSEQVYAEQLLEQMGTVMDDAFDAL